MNSWCVIVDSFSLCFLILMCVVVYGRIVMLSCVIMVVNSSLVEFVLKLILYDRLVLCIV